MTGKILGKHAKLIYGFDGLDFWRESYEFMLHAVAHLGIYMTRRWRWLTIAMYLWRKLERATPAHKCTVCIIFQFIWLEFNCAWQYTRKRWYRQIFHMHLLIFKLHTKAEACIGTYRLKVNGISVYLEKDNTRYDLSGFVIRGRS